MGNPRETTLSLFQPIHRLSPKNTTIKSLTLWLVWVLFNLRYHSTAGLFYQLLKHVIYPRDSIIKKV